MAAFTPTVLRFFRGEAMYEHHRAPLVPRRVFLGRLVKHGMEALLLVFGTLWLGMAGYHWFEGLSWIDAYLNAAMILGGMGPVAELRTDAGKIFAGSYALFAGIVFLVSVGVIFAPIIHRAMHRFHLDDEGAGPSNRTDSDTRPPG